MKLNNQEKETGILSEMRKQYVVGQVRVHANDSNE